MTHVPCTPAAEIPETLAPTGALGLTSAQLQARLDEIHPVGSIAVSYTHLTLPTIYSV